ncbi:hypothetical protein HMN09_00853300 [Mycena chlorophos]|uniref:Uncharacterized protein n=1 Tax=Mycena chlorophos TaxID=658473 RepID=A0A8H6STB4_MYCCL|nr:hypothetical protein HMN09_00853300 [Mycena chlorophos]
MLVRQASRPCPLSLFPWALRPTHTRFLLQVMPVVRRAFSRGASDHRVAFQRAPTNGATAARLRAGGFFTFDATSTDNGTSNTQASIQSNTDSGSGASATSTDIIPPAPVPAPGPLPGGGPPPPGPGVPPPGPNSPQQPTRPLANAPNPTSLLQQSSLSPSSPPTSSSVPFPTGSTTFSNVGGAPTSVSPLASSRTASGSGTNNVAGLIAGLLVLLLLLIIGAFFAIRRRKSRAGPPAASGDSGEPDSEATGARWQALEALPSLTFRGVAGIDSEWQSMAEKPLQPLRPGLLRMSDTSLSTSRSRYGGTWNNDIDRGTRTTTVLPPGAPCGNGKRRTEPIIFISVTDAIFIPFPNTGTAFLAASPPAAPIFAQHPNIPPCRGVKFESPWFI